MVVLTAEEKRGFRSPTYKALTKHLSGYVRPAAPDKVEVPVLAKSLYLHNCYHLEKEASEVQSVEDLLKFLKVRPRKLSLTQNIAERVVRDLGLTVVNDRNEIVPLQLSFLTIVPSKVVRSPTMNFLPSITRLDISGKMGSDVLKCFIQIDLPELISLTMTVDNWKQSDWHLLKKYHSQLETLDIFGDQQDYIRFDWFADIFPNLKGIRVDPPIHPSSSEGCLNPVTNLTVLELLDCSMIPDFNFLALFPELHRIWLNKATRSLHPRQLTRSTYSRRLTTVVLTNSPDVVNDTLLEYLKNSGISLAHLIIPVRPSGKDDSSPGTSTHHQGMRGITCDGLKQFLEWRQNDRLLTLNVGGHAGLKLWTFTLKMFCVTTLTNFDIRDTGMNVPNVVCSLGRARKNWFSRRPVEERNRCPECPLPELILIVDPSPTAPAAEMYKQRQHVTNIVTRPMRIGP
jgi:hypothetical protein